MKNNATRKKELEHEIEGLESQIHTRFVKIDELYRAVQDFDRADAIKTDKHIRLISAQKAQITKLKNKVETRKKAIRNLS